jgi:hypothetical protein
LPFPLSGRVDPLVDEVLHADGGFHTRARMRVEQQGAGAFAQRFLLRLAELVFQAAQRLQGLEAHLAVAVLQGFEERVDGALALEQAQPLGDARPDLGIGIRAKMLQQGRFDALVAHPHHQADQHVDEFGTRRFQAFVAQRVEQGFDGAVLGQEEILPGLVAFLRAAAELFDAVLEGWAAASAQETQQGVEQ